MWTEVHPLLRQDSNTFNLLKIYLYRGIHKNKDSFISFQKHRIKYEIKLEDHHHRPLQTFSLKRMQPTKILTLSFLRTGQERQDNEKHENKRNQYQQPRNSRVPILADQVQYPSPEQDVDEFYHKQQQEIRNAHMHASQLQSVHVAGEILERNND
jgi:hypothetical protein